MDQEKQLCVNVEPLHRVIREVVSLSYEEYKEIGSIDQSIEYNPDIEEMLKYEGGGKCVLVTARYNSVMVGYALFLIGPYKFNKDLEYASLEAIYLSPVFRGGFTAMGMIRLGEKEVIKTNNVAFFAIASSIRYPIDILLKRLGYKPLDTLYVRKV